MHWLRVDKDPSQINVVHDHSVLVIMSLAISSLARFTKACSDQVRTTFVVTETMVIRENVIFETVSIHPHLMDWPFRLAVHFLTRAIVHRR